MKEKFARKNKNKRGFGRFRLLSVKHQTYDKTNFLEYAQSYKKDILKMKPDCRNQWLDDSEVPSMIHIDVPLRMRGYQYSSLCIQKRGLRSFGTYYRSWCADYSGQQSGRSFAAQDSNDTVGHENGKNKTSGEYQ